MRWLQWVLTFWLGVASLGVLASVPIAKEFARESLLDQQKATDTFLKFLQNFAPVEAARLAEYDVKIVPQNIDSSLCNVPHRLAMTEIVEPKQVVIRICTESIVDFARVLAAFKLVWMVSKGVDQENKNVRSFLLSSTRDIVSRFSKMKSKQPAGPACHPGILAFTAVQSIPDCSIDLAEHAATEMWARIVPNLQRVPRDLSEEIALGYWGYADLIHEISSHMVLQLVLAHEVAHVLNGDLAPGVIYSRTQEEAADEFAVKVVARLPDASALAASESAHLVMLTFSIGWYWADREDFNPTEAARMDSAGRTFLCHARRQLREIGSVAGAEQIEAKIERLGIDCSGIPYGR